MRSHSGGDLRSDAIDSTVLLSGWVDRRRDHGGVIFIDLRDRSGTVQITVDPDLGAEAFAVAEHLRNETVLQVEGRVRARPDESRNERLATGEVEVLAQRLKVLNAPSRNLPFAVSVHDDEQVREELRLRYRYLDLRRERMRRNLSLRHQTVQTARRFLEDEGFIEVETPVLTRSTPEGARDYLVPSRVCGGEWFALPQSPQLFKQLCMSGGLERVFEIGPAFRAEKHDTYRHLNEFISFDIECSWANDDDVMGVLERMIHHMWKSVSEDPESQQHIDTINTYRATQDEEPIEVIVPELPFPRLSYCDAIATIQRKGGEIEWGDDIDAENSDLLAEDLPQFYFLPRWPMDLKPFYIHHVEGEDGSTGRQLSRGFDLNFGRDELTSGGQREHRMDVLIENLKAMELDPEEFEFYVAGFRHGVPPHAGWGLGVERILMKLTGSKNVRETVLFPRDRRRVSP